MVSKMFSHYTCCKLRNLGGQEFVDKLLVVQDIELKRLMKGKELQNFVNATKKHPPSDSFPYTGKIKLKNPTGLIQARTRAIYANGRFTGTLAKSDHTLDTLEGLEKCLVQNDWLQTNAHRK